MLAVKAQAATGEELVDVGERARSSVNGEVEEGEVVMLMTMEMLKTAAMAALFDGGGSMGRRGCRNQPRSSSMARGGGWVVGWACCR